MIEPMQDMLLLVVLQFAMHTRQTLQFNAHNLSSPNGNQQK